MFVAIIGPTFTEPATGLTFSVSGQATNTLRVSRITLGTHPRTIRFRAAVSNTCGTVTSGTALLTVCKADLDCDGFTSGDDYGIFVAWFEGGDPGADFDGDGFITGDDFQLFVEAFEAGC